MFTGLLTQFVSYVEVPLSLTTLHLEAHNVMHLRTLQLITLSFCTDSVGRTAMNCTSEDTGFSQSPRTQLIRYSSQSTLCAESVQRGSEITLHETMQQYLNQCIKHHQILLE
jgi:hypothetical protein